MPVTEPIPTALLLIVGGLLMAVSVFSSRASGRFGVPVALGFLVIGMLAGSEGLGGIHFENYRFAFRFGTVALVLILFDGGLNTPLPSIVSVMRPAGVLATVGVAGIAGAVAVCAWLLGLPWPEAMLLGAIVSSTDAAAVFAVLRGSGLQLKRRVGVTLEVESGANDPMAVILTLALTDALVSGTGLGWGVLFQVVQQLVVGALGGVAAGYAGRALVRRVRVTASGLYPVVTLSIAFLAFGVPTVLNGSGFLAVYVTGVLLGNDRLPFRAGVLRVHDAIAWFCQVSMFLLLGVLVYPSRLVEVWWTGLAVALALAFVARPLVVTLCLLPFRYPANEVVYIAWIGLRGAVPIILATFPVLARAPGSERIFDIVFFVVVVSAIIPGATVRWMTRALGLEANLPPAPAASLEITSIQPLSGDVLSFFIDPASPVRGARIVEIPFPEDAAVMLVVRGQTLLAARGATVLEPGDHVFVFCKPEDRTFIQLMFGRAEEG